MTARTGVPLRIAVRLDGGEADYEIQLPADGTELVVCGDCGFTWDAEGTVTDDQGRVGYECPRCVLQLFVAARQRVIEDTVRDGVKQLAATLRRDVAQYKQQADAAQAELARVHAAEEARPALRTSEATPEWTCRCPPGSGSINHPEIPYCSNCKTHRPGLGLISGEAPRSSEAQPEATPGHTCDPYGEGYDFRCKGCLAMHWFEQGRAAPQSQPAPCAYSGSCPHYASAQRTGEAPPVLCASDMNADGPERHADLCPAAQHPAEGDSTHGSA